MKKVVIFCITIIMLFTLSACGHKSETDKNEFVLKSKDSVALEAPTYTVDPSSVYAKLSYEPEMFYGSYRLFGGEEALEAYRKEMDYIDIDLKIAYSKKITKIPYGIEAGPHTIRHSVSYIKGYNWMRVYFQSDAGNLDELLCAYTIDGNKITLKPLDKFHVDKESNKITYAFGTPVLEYEFQFNGTDLTLSCDGKSVTMKTGLNVSDDEPYFHVDSYCSPESEMLDNIDKILLVYRTSSDSYISISGKDYKLSIHNAGGVLTRDGVLTFTVPWESGTKTYQYVYFYCGNDGIVLTDGEKVFKYNQTYSDRNKTDLTNYLSEDNTDQLDDITDSKLEEIVKRKDDLISDLAEAFHKEGIQVTANKANGELALDASVLFGGDSAVITADGKMLLNKFLEVYTSIIYNEKYSGFIAKTRIEGHTAPVSGSTYESGLPLSQERASNVKEYCLSAETGIDTSKLSNELEAVGYSNSKPIYNANGEIDTAACRRVSFRFLVNIG